MVSLEQVPIKGMTIDENVKQQNPLDFLSDPKNYQKIRDKQEQLKKEKKKIA